MEPLDQPVKGIAILQKNDENLYVYKNLGANLRFFKEGGQVQAPEYSHLDTHDQSLEEVSRSHTKRRNRSIVGINTSPTNFIPRTLGQPITARDFKRGMLSQDGGTWKTPNHQSQVFNQSEVFNHPTFRQFKKNFNFSLAHQSKMTQIKDNVITTNVSLRNQINTFFNDNTQRKATSIGYRDYSKIDASWPLKGSQKHLAMKGDGFLPGPELRLQTHSIDCEE